jgi:hypothetical protein
MDHKYLASWQRTLTFRLLVGLMAMMVIVATGWRVIRTYQPPGPFDETRLGYCDFHNGVYYPALAWLRGDNPYSVEYASTYPVMRQVPLYSPLVFAIHAPLAVLELRTAEVVYFGIMLMVLASIARLLCRDCRAANGLYAWYSGTIFLLALVSRPGHATLYSGYFTLELILATLLVFHWRQKVPWLAAIALAFTSIKPTYAIPLALLLLALQQYRLVARGTLIGAVLAILPFIWIAVNSGEDTREDQVRHVFSTMLSTQDVHREQNWEKPEVSWTRVDTLGLIAKWQRWQPTDSTHLIAMVLILIPVAGVLWRTSSRWNSDSGQVTGPITALVLVALQVSLYKHAYDTLVLLAPITGLVARTTSWSGLTTRGRSLIVFLLALPLVNYGSTHLVLNHPRLVDLVSLPGVIGIITSINSIAMFVALLVLCWFAWQMAGDKQGEIS